jgi:hypothetical protein
MINNQRLGCENHTRPDNPLQQPSLFPMLCCRTSATQLPYRLHVPDYQISGRPSNPWQPREHYLISRLSRQFLCAENPVFETVRSPVDGIGVKMPGKRSFE